MDNLANEAFSIHTDQRTSFVHICGGNKVLQGAKIVSNPVISHITSSVASPSQLSH